MKIKINNKISRYASTFLVPFYAEKDLQRIFMRFGSVRNFLHKIVISKHALLALKPRENEGKTLYQEKGQNLQRLDFRPFEEDWERLRLLAASQRISMSRMFVLFLLFWDYDSVEVPTKPQKILLYQSLTLSNKEIWIKISRFII